MNEILQKRIEEVAENHEQCYNVGEEHGYLYTHKGDVKEAVIYGATFALRNQWISVEEALPDYEEDVLVTNDVGDYWFSHRTENENVMRDENNFASVNGIFKITYWMPIPEMKGGE